MTKRFFMFVFVCICVANISAVNEQQLNLNPTPYSSGELDQIKQYLFDNITTSEHEIIKDDKGQIIHSIPGAVLASPTLHGANFVQDYQFHWVRDAAITMNEVVYLYENSSDKSHLKPYLINYINFEYKAQQQVSRADEQTLGQPKYNIDATIWEGEWGRPQNDGPALRAITMIAIANVFLHEGDEQYVQDKLLQVIRTDLDYVADQWHAANFDLWEEVKDQDHFFNKMTQRKSLIEGAALFKRMQDQQRSDAYLHVAEDITTSLERHWNASRGYLTETVNQQYMKGGGIDTSIILGVLYGDLNNPDDAFAVNNERVMSSVFFIRNAFAGLYRVNIEDHLNPPLVGRYPGDVYDGDKDNYGNPWLLTTNALAQYYYAVANVYLKLGKINVSKTNLLFFQQLDANLVAKEELITAANNPGKFYTIINALMSEGDQALATVKRHTVCYNNFSCLHMAEQIDRTSGAPTSAKDLSWSYATVLTAMQARAAINLH